MPYSPVIQLAHSTTQPRRRGVDWRCFFLPLLAVVSAVVLAPHMAYAVEPSFTQALPLGLSEPTQSVAVGDFNGDGFSDIVQGNDGQSYVYLNDGRGGFTRRTPLGNGEIILHIMVADLNSDGFLDIISPSKVYLNDGRGDFSAPGIALAGGAIAYLVAVGDLNSDGFLDIILGGYQQSSYIYLNDGQGRFPDIGIPLGSDVGAINMAVGDFNGDGFLDIVQSIIQGNTGVQIYAYLNNGRGGFTQRTTVGGSENTVSIAVGDFNRDGFLDIISERAIYLNDGQGAFSTRDLTLGDIWGTRSIAVGDLNKDGVLDIVQGNDGQSYVYLNDGQGHFPVTGMALGSIHRTYDVAIGDLNADGFLDIVQGNYEDSSYIYLSDEQGGFSTPAITLAGVQDPKGGAVGDLNRDGFLDIILANNEQSYVYLNDRWGGFSDPGIALGSVQNTWGMAVGDLNGDSFLDIVQGNADQSYVYLNDRRGHFPTAGIPLGGSARGVAVGDLNRDSFLDIILASNGQSYAYLNDGQGGFTQGIPIGDNTEGTSSVAVGDFNSDGLLDVVLGNNANYSYVYLNDGQGGFPTIGIELGGIQTFSMAVGDLNSDGSLDLVKSSFDQNYVYLNDGLGHFPITGSALGNIQRTYSIAIGDLNSDGFLDIAQSNESQGYIYLNDRQGGFAQSVPLGKGWTALVMMGDLNNDGLLDIIQGNKVYRNTLRQTTALTNHSPQIAITRPGPTGNANFFSTPAVLDSPTIPITYTLFDQEGVNVGRVEATYSLNGGGAWLPAVATGGTITQNLSTGRSLARALTTTTSIPAKGSAPLQARLAITPSLILADVEVWLTITHTNNAALAITVQSPQGTQVPLVAAGQAHGQNFQQTRFAASAVTAILSGTAPYTGTYQPIGDLTAFKGEPSNGVWTLVITNTGTSTGTLAAWGLQLKNPPATHVFEWDTLASGFFGQSDNVVLRLVAYNQPLTTTLPITGSYRYPHSGAGPYQQSYASATTFPFRVRSTQVRVLDSSSQPAPNALVYRLPRGAVTGAEPMPSAGQPLTTTRNGYLPGRGALAIGDQLVALQPISATHAFTLYYTSAAPTASGLALQPVAQAGVQTLTVSAANPLVLFDLDLTLEWDARNDDLFLEQLNSALARTSAVLFDVSNGQMALGNVRIHQAREQWVAADVVLYAGNSIHPRASMGGVVITPTHELGVSGVISNAYLPGQIRIGPNWDPFGQNQAELTEDWSRALAHELAHYLLFLPDNYLGIADNRLRMTNCRGSFMTNAHDAEGYSEFLPRADWLGDCQQTVAERLTGRTDWETILRFFPWLHAPSTAAEAPGPSALPLNLLRISYLPLSHPAVTLPARNYDLRDENGQLLIVQQAQAYLFQSHGTPDLTDDSVIALGSTGNGSDRIKVRGAAPGDRLCLLAANQMPARLGCRVITPDSGAIQLAPVNGWQPVITVSPITSRTLAITVTQAAPVGPLYVQVLPAYGALTGTALITAPLIFAPWAALPALDPANPVTYTQVITLAYPAFEGFIRVWAPGGEPSNITEREALTQFFLSAAWGPPKSGFGGADTRVWGPPKSGFGGADTRAWGANHRALAAPVASGDGKVTIFNLTDLLGETGVATLQTLASLPQVPLWLTPIGQGYRLTIDADHTLTIAFHYLQREAPAGYEQTLALYYSPDNGATWQRLPTLLDVEENLAAAQIPANDQHGAGLYALMATLTMPALTPGWNQFAYPLPQARPVPVALASLADAYTALYHFDPAAQPIRQAHDKPHWRFYAPAVAADHPALAGFVNDLTTLTFGQSYWLHATAAITPYLGVGGDPSVFAVSHATGLELPPAILYGVITVPESIPLAVGTVLTALVDGNPCGQTTVESWQGQLVYKLQVAADTGNGCGIVGRTVTLALQDKTVATAIAWDNRRPAAQPLFLGDAGQRLFLPIVSQK